MQLVRVQQVVPPVPEEAKFPIIYPDLRLDYKVATLPFSAPGRAVFQASIKQRAFKTDVAASFLALDPFVTKDFLAFGKNSLYNPIESAIEGP